MSSNKPGDKFLATRHLSTDETRFEKLLYAGQTTNRRSGPKVFLVLSD